MYITRTHNVKIQIWSEFEVNSLKPKSHISKEKWFVKMKIEIRDTGIHTIVKFFNFNLMQIYIAHWEDCIRLIYCTSQCFLHRPLFSVLCHSFLRGIQPLQDQLPGEHTGLLSQTEQCLFLSFGPSVQDSHIHSLIVDRSMVVGHVPMDHVFFYVHLSHRHDSTQPSLFTSWVALCERLYARIT